MRQAVILAGGKGTRLASRLNGAPKPLVDVDGIPLLERQLRQLAAAGFTQAIILVSHRRDVIEAFCAQLHVPGLKVIVRDDGKTARGTAGATFEARELLADRFLVVYGDTLFDIDLDRFWSAHEAKRASGVEATLFLHPNDHPYDSDLVDMDGDGRVRAFHPKPHAPGVYLRNLVNAALYVIEKKLLLACPPGEGVVDFGKDLFPAMIAAGHKLQGYVTYEYIKDLGTPDRLDRVTADLRSGKVARARLTELQKAVFLDRDGTLNVPAGHISSPEALTLFPGVGEAVRRLNRAEFRCVLTTNQPVVARGECTIDGLANIHAKLETKLGEAKAYLDGIYVCPHHPDKGFAGEVAALKKVCDCRKPAPGLLLQAAKDLSIDLKRSWMVGDSTADIGAARAAGVRSILVRGGDVTATSHAELPDYEVANLTEAASLIVEGEAAARAALAPWMSKIKAGMLVRISGQSRSGKSILASTLKLMLAEQGVASAHVRQDHWTKDGARRAEGGGVRSRYDMEAMQAALAGWMNGGALDIVAPRYLPQDRISKPGGARIVLPANGVLIVEGILAFDVPAGERASLSLFVRVAEAVRRHRFMAEYARRGVLPKQAGALYLSRMRDEFPAIEDGRDNADGIVSASAFEKVHA